MKNSHTCVRTFFAVLLIASQVPTTKVAFAADARAARIVQGLHSLADKLSGTVGLPILTQPIPLTTLTFGSTNALNMSALFRQVIGSALTDQHENMDGLVAALDGLDGNYSGVAVTIADVVATHDSAGDQIRFTLSASRDVSSSVNLATGAADLHGTLVNTQLTLTAPFALQLDAGQPDSSASFSLLSPLDITASARISESVTPSLGRLGLLATQVTGTAQISTSIKIEMIDPDRNGHTTQDEWENTAPEDLFQGRILTGSVNAQFNLAPAPLPTGEAWLPNLSSGMVSLVDADLTDGLSASTVSLGGLQKFSTMTPRDTLAGLVHLARAIAVMQAAGNLKVPLLHDRLGDHFNAADPVIQFVRRFTDAQLVCGRRNTQPPSGDISLLPPGVTTVYCQAFALEQPISVTWRIANGTILSGTNDARTVGSKPSANAVFTVNGPGAPQVSVQFVDAAGATHEASRMFDSLQDFYARLRDLGGFDLSANDLAYDDATSSLTLRLRKSSDPLPFTNPIEFGGLLAQQSGLTNLHPTSGATATVDLSKTNLDITFGMFLMTDTHRTASGLPSASQFFIKAAPDAATHLFATDLTVDAKVMLSGTLGPIEVSAAGDAPGSHIQVTPTHAGMPEWTIDLAPLTRSLTTTNGTAISNAIVISNLLLLPSLYVKPLANFGVSTTLQISVPIGVPAHSLAAGRVAMVWPDVMTNTLSVSPDTAFLSQVKRFDVEPGQPRRLVVNLLDQMSAVLSEIEQSSRDDIRQGLLQRLTVVTTTPKQLLPQLAELKSILTGLRADPPATIQALDRRLSSALKLPIPALDVELTENSSALVVRFVREVCASAGQALPTCASNIKIEKPLASRLLIALDSQRSLIGDQTNVSLPLEYTSTVRLGIVLPLTPTSQISTSLSSPVVLGETGADIRIGIHAEQVAMPASLGGTNVFVTGTVKLDVAFRLGSASSDPTPVQLGNFVQTLTTTLRGATQQDCGQSSNTYLDGFACARLYLSAPPTSTTPITITPPITSPNGGPPSGISLTRSIYLPAVYKAAGIEDTIQDQHELMNPSAAKSGGVETQFVGADSAPLPLGEIGFVTRGNDSRQMSAQLLGAGLGLGLGEVFVPKALEAALAEQPIAWDKLPAALDEALEKVESALKTASKVPLVGGNLDAGTNAVNEVRTQVTKPLKDLATSVRNELKAGAIISRIQSSLLTTISPTLLIDGPDSGTDITREDISITLKCGTKECLPDSPAEEISDIRVNFVIGQGIDASGQVDQACDGVGCIERAAPFDLGLPGVPFKLEGSMKGQVRWRYHIDLGLSKQDGPYVVVGGAGHGDKSELGVGASMRMDQAPDACDGEPPVSGEGLLNDGKWSDRCLRGTLGFVDVVVRDGLDIKGTATADKNDDATRVQFVTQLDLRSSASAVEGIQRLTIAQLFSNLDVSVSLSATANVDWRIQTSVAGVEGMPSVLGTFHLFWELGQPGKDLSELRFDDLYLNPGPFVDRFVKPIAETFKKITEPFNPIIDVLYGRMPIISDIYEFLGGDPVRMKDVLELFKTIPDLNWDVLDHILELADFIKNLPIGPGGSLLVPLGANNSGGGFSISKSLAKISELTFDDVSRLIDTEGLRLRDGQGFQGEFTTRAGLTTHPGSLSFPFLENPIGIFQHLLGQDVALVRYDFGSLTAGAGLKYSIPIFPFLSVDIQGAIGVEGRLALGYTTRGLRQAVQKGEPFKFVNGLYIDDSDGSSDVPEFIFKASVSVAATLGFDIGILGVEVSAGGAIEGRLEMDLNDRDGDGRLYIDEIAASLNNPLCLFNVTGAIDIYAFAQGYLKVFFVTLIDKRWELGRFRLFSFGLNPCGGDGDKPKPVLAQSKPGDPTTLQLNMGSEERRKARAFAVDDVNESFTVRQLSSTLPACFTVAAFGISQNYCGFNRIEADADDGDDSIILQGGFDTGGNAITFTAPALFNGGPGNDAISSGAGDDQLIGGEGNDTVLGGAGNDALSGETGDDFIDGGHGNDTITGGDGNDRVIGGSGSDTIDAGGGDDHVEGGGGGANAPDLADRIVGGLGTDEIIGDEGDDVIFGDEETTCNATGAGDGGPDSISGGLGNDQIFGGSGDDGISGGVGDDTLCGNGGNDTLYGDQVDQVTVTDGNDVLDGGDGNDVLLGAGGDDDLFGRAGNDRLVGDFGDDNLSGGLGDDHIEGGPGRDYLFGDDGTAVRPAGQLNASSISLSESIGGNDVLIGADGDDVLYGEGGNDELYGDDGQDDMHGNAGNDLMRGGLLSDVMYGDAGDDQMFGDSGDDRMFGGEGNDGMRGNAGDDYIEGNNGADIIHGDADEDDIVGGSAQAGAADEESNNGANANVAALVAGKGDTLYGDAGFDVIAGDNAQITRPGGKNTFDGSTIRTIVLLDVDSANTHVAGNDYSNGGDANDRIFGQAGDDTLRGGSGDDYIEGNASNDHIYGDADQDDLIGGSAAAGRNDGNDVISGGNGVSDVINDYDVILGDNGLITRPLLDGKWQTNTFNNAIKRDVTLFDVLLAGQTANPAVFGNDTLLGEANDDVICGQSGDDLARGGSGDDIIEGNAGNDTVFGDAGNDDLIGGSSAANRQDGADVIWGGTGAAQVESDHDVILGDNGLIVCPLSFSAWQINYYDGSIKRQVTLFDEVLIGQPVVAGVFGNDTLNGEAGNDRIYGQGGVDTAHGGAGDDYIEGNAEGDSLFGDAGQDDVIGGTAAPGRIDADDVIYGGDGQTQLPNDHDVLLGDNGSIARPLTCGRWEMHAYDQSIIRNVTLFEVSSVEHTVVVRGNDRIFGESGNDTIYGQGGNDEIHGGAGDDVIQGNADDDTIYGDTGNDDIVGGTGRINADPAGGVNGRTDGRDIIMGGTGFDTIAGDNAILARTLVGEEPPPVCPGDPRAVVPPLEIAGRWVTNTFNSGVQHELRILLDVDSPSEAVTNGDDIIYGDDDDDLIYGQGGDDILFGGAGDDVIEGNDGGDSISGGAGDDDIVGGSTEAGVFDSKADQIHGGDGNDLIIGDNGNVQRTLDNEGRWQHDERNGFTLRDVTLYDLQQQNAYVDTRLSCYDFIYGDAGHDALFGQGGNDQLYSGSDPDYVEGNQGDDAVFGGAGDDVLIGGSTAGDGHIGSGNWPGNLADGTNSFDRVDTDDITEGNGGVPWQVP